MVEILQNEKEIASARADLRRRCIDVCTSPFNRWLRRMRLVRSVAVGEYVKGWDLLKTIDFIVRHLVPTDPVLDLGAFASETLLMLQRLNYTSLAGIDLNPNLLDMPCSKDIQYRVGSFLESDYPEATFAAVTAISVIEHGFDGPRLVKEVSRLLRPGGYFLASFDYWPEKIDTTGLYPFDLTWTIFSRRDILDFIRVAETEGMMPVGEVSLEASERPVEWMNRAYTFGWLALRKE